MRCVWLSALCLDLPAVVELSGCVWSETTVGQLICCEGLSVACGNVLVAVCAVTID